ncbi:R-linalool synthase QH1, chloroplastic isoform X5 [Helianthus annuus]|uniref:R-linalool synthase QH1, chloroplastic isoform X5 n=1 Tax=Helianthus annuus TaxID=4232 RepID=UPI001653362D|nr:R-linalool synthase QH1, chloroplastic isoform X5 [Helianthus annuus]
MASMSVFPCSTFYYKKYHDIGTKFVIRKPIYATQSTSKVVTAETVPRRSANYASSLWSFDQIQSLSSEYVGQDYKAMADTLKDAVKMMIHKGGNQLNTLQMIDDLQRLGISYHFEDEIRNLLEMIYCNYYKTPEEWNGMDLNLKALGFRLLRQHGYQVPQEIFHDFKDKMQNFKPYLADDMMGILNLYEASSYSLEDESILDHARDFTTKYMKENQDKTDKSISSLVTHALELPLHWRVPRVEAKWFIEQYEQRADKNPTLIDLAKLDFDMVQAVHIEDLKHASRWWRNKKWDKKLSFSRDRLVEHFLWSTGFCHLPQHSLGRRTMTKWAGLCKAYLVEARWYNNGHTPTLQEYLDNAYTSISAPAVLMHANFVISVHSSNDILQSMPRLEKTIYYSSLIFRLADDLATSSDELARGDVSKSIQCYMHESGATEEEAREYIKELILETWKKINKERAHANSQFERGFIEYATNISRMALLMYSDGDGHGCPDLTKSHVSSLFFNPLQGI